MHGLLDKMLFLGGLGVRIQGLGGRQRLVGGSAHDARLFSGMFCYIVVFWAPVILLYYHEVHRVYTFFPGVTEQPKIWQLRVDLLAGAT